MISKEIAALVGYAREKGLIDPADTTWAVNSLLAALKLDSYDPQPIPEGDIDLPGVLKALLDDAAARGVLENDSVVYRDLLDTELMGRLTPRPSQVAEKFWSLYAGDPKAATDWFYRFSQDTNYIRRDRIAKDIQWKAQTEYGTLDITINLSKPEKDPKAIAAARNMPAAGYPKCLLCYENEGYAGRVNHPARQNHRPIPLQICGADWALQYSPYVYYNEHCILFNRAHIPMKIHKECFDKLLSFVEQFPHYFIGSNADLPIVGGSILAHEHFQGGRYTFAMATAPVERNFTFPGFEDVQAGIVKWPMSVIRLTCADPARLSALADRILGSWRSYTDQASFIFAYTGDEPHNTITPIARRCGTDFQLDLVLRNNITTEEYPLGVYHPHQELHHIKKENIGLIEVMGLAVLPARLKDELARLAELLVTGGDVDADPDLSKHGPWVAELKQRYTFTAENVQQILQQEVGKVFSQVLEHAGVYKRTPEGQAAFLRFLEQV